MPTFTFEDRESISNLGSFLSDLEAVRSATATLGNTWYFRGDPFNRALRPSIGHDLRFAGRTLVADEPTERKLLNRFRRFAWSHLNRVQSDWEALFLARHYGLPTRILDWSSNPLVALYFACSPAKKLAREGAVWGLLRIPEEHADVDIFDRPDPMCLFPGNPVAVKLIYPVYNSERITAQKGIFSWHSHPRISLEMYAGQDFDDDKLDVAYLVRWPVNRPASEATRGQLVQDLERLAVNQRSIFPDLGGLATGLWHTEVLWKGTA